MELSQQWWSDAGQHLRWRQIGMAFAILCGAIASAGLLAGGRELFLIALLMATWCAVSGWRRARECWSGRRTGWLGVTAASACAAIGQAWWLAKPPDGNATLTELPGHLGMIGALAIFLVAVVCLRPPRRETANSPLLLLDLVIVMSTLVTALWALVISPSGNGDGGLSLREAVAGAHAGIGGLLLLALFVIGLRLPASGGQRSVALLTAGLSSIALADLGWSVLWVNGGTDWIQPAAALMAAAFALFAIVLGRERRRFAGDVASDEAEPGAEAAWRLWLLYPPVLLLALIVGESAIGTTNQTSDPVVILGSLIVIALVLLRQGVSINEARRISAQLQFQADRDPLTNLLNHRKLHERLERELAGARRDGYPVAVALIDVDRFKQINDQLGHVVGDHVLRAIARTLSGACRATDTAARYAGDEFVLILPGLEGRSAAIVGDRLLDEVAALAYWPGPDADDPVSISVGFAISRTGLQSGRQMIAAADEALYSAKRSGRNRFALVDADAFVYDEEPVVDPRRLFILHPTD